jgi:hypothetical protein
MENLESPLAALLREKKEEIDSASTVRSYLGESIVVSVNVTQISFSPDKVLKAE